MVKKLGILEGKLGSGFRVMRFLKVSYDLWGEGLIEDVGALARRRKD
jgi:hypothetical protein